MDGQIGRNDPCWCGSDRKFKKYHLGRETADRLPFEAIRDAARKAWNKKFCLHPLAAPGECDKIVSAHTVQRSGVLERIVDSTNHVETFYHARTLMSGNPEPRRIGWRDASTFTGFCAKHDNGTFAPLEKHSFTGTNQQSFLVGYRALCHEIYQKKGFLRGFLISQYLANQGRTCQDQRKIQQDLALLDAGARKGLSTFENLKKSMDGQILSARYSGWSRLIIRFRGELCIAGL